MKASKKVSKTLCHKNGHGGFSSVPREMQRSAAFHSLTASAIRVLLWALFKQYHSASTRHEAETGNPKFRLTNAEAQDVLGLTAQTFSRAKKELYEKGFLCWVVRGGLRGCNGVASEYALSGKWKDWIPPKIMKPTMNKARTALNKQQKEVATTKPEKPYPHGNNINVSSSLDRPDAETCNAALTG